MTLTDRDRKIMIALVPILILVAYWFLLLAPKRDEASKAGDDLAVQEQRLDVARDKLQTAEGAKESFKASYAQVVRLGKAIPSTVDMPSLLVQLNAAAKGTGIRFTHIKTGERTAAATTTAAPAGSESGTTGTPAAAGGETAQSQPGQAAESANNAQQTANQSSAATESASDTQTSTPAGATDATGTAAAAPVGLETVPLELEFRGNFFNLADFFHQIKRFVSLTNRDVVVGGRLITVEGINWKSDETLFPNLVASIKATVYLSPKAEGVTAGASPSGPATTTPDGTTPASTTTPTATATP